MANVWGKLNYKGGLELLLLSPVGFEQGSESGLAAFRLLMGQITFGPLAGSRGGG